MRRPFDTAVLFALCAAIVAMPGDHVIVRHHHARNAEAAHGDAPHAVGHVHAGVEHVHVHVTVDVRSTSHAGRSAEVVIVADFEAVSGRMTKRVTPRPRPELAAAIRFVPVGRTGPTRSGRGAEPPEVPPPRRV